MSSDNLGRLVAAERNAMAAINWSKEARDQLNELTARLSKLEAENVQLKADIQRLNALVFARFSGGPTA